MPCLAPTDLVQAAGTGASAAEVAALRQQLQVQTDKADVGSGFGLWWGTLTGDFLPLFVSTLF